MVYHPDISSSISQRPWELPKGKWTYYQEWNQVLFLHYLIPAEILTSLIPKDLELDLFENNAWVSAVVFKMEKIRPRRLPALPIVSDFYEINLRTYVKKGKKSGVYFLNIEAQKALSAFISRKLSGLPYEKSNISTSTLTDSTLIKSLNRLKGFKLEADFKIGANIKVKTKLDFWLTERYCLYLVEGDNIFKYEIHHEEWEITEVDLKSLEINYQIQQLKICSPQPDLVHYSKGVRVLAWNRTLC